MNISDLEQVFINSTNEECKNFLKRNRQKLIDKNLLGRFYKLYARKNKYTHENPLFEEMYQIFSSPLK